MSTFLPSFLAFCNDDKTADNHQRHMDPISYITQNSTQIPHHTHLYHPLPLLLHNLHTHASHTYAFTSSFLRLRSVLISV